MALKIEDLADDITNTIDEDVNMFMEDGVKELRRVAPRDTGNLSQSFKRRGKDEIISDAGYAPVVDARQNFVLPALERVEKRIFK